MGDKKAVDTIIKDGLWDAYNNYHMGTTAENICDVWGITREELDVFGAASQQNACAAIDSGLTMDGIDEVAANDEIYVVIITGEGRSFVAGADIGEMRDLTSIRGQEVRRPRRERFPQAGEHAQAGHRSGERLWGVSKRRVKGSQRKKKGQQLRDGGNDRSLCDGQTGCRHEQKQ